MNKNSVLRYVGKTNYNFTNGKKYKIVAGRGDGVPRNNGTLGAYIQSPLGFVVNDDNRNLCYRTFSDNWELVKDSGEVSWYKPESNMDPIPISKVM
ncbi:hypothetical protein [Escherichia phage SKA49]|uniref:Uncharacterized protein n=1 Tax=Escherichia phage SKA49 TaxID=2910155 RepID=A0A9E6YBF4_9CAUD|nr:hypothetical protein QNH01_gp12 [Escherichia phage SKA49]UIU47100.1 hypothetical protein [Escherichia phage SKA49]